MASLLTALQRPFAFGLTVLLPSLAAAQAVSPQGGEYSLGTMSGDQTFPSVSLGTNGGYVVWEDSLIDGNGRGIGALRLDSNFSPLFGAFRVNQRTAGDQVKPQVTVFKNGGAAIVWQSGGQRYANVYGRFLNPNGTFTGTNDIRINSTTNSD